MTPSSSSAGHYSIFPTGSSLPHCLQRHQITKLIMVYYAKELDDGVYNINRGI